MSEIIAYGSGEMLEKVFNAIAMLMNGGGKSAFRPLLMICALVGGIWAFAKAYWDSTLNGLLFQWLIPMVGFMCICVIPTMSITIKDVLVSGSSLGSVYTVDNIPLGLARTAQTISTIGYAVTTLIETTFHTPGQPNQPDQPMYNKTGMIFGGENLLEISRYAITDEDLADTMREFVQNCVTYDLMLELYSIEDLKKSSNIWKLIKENTSNVRMFSFCKKRSDPSNNSQAHLDRRKRCELVSCRDGTAKLDQLLGAYTTKLKANPILQHLPLLYQQLTGMAHDTQDFITQQTMMHTLIDAVERKCEASGIGTNFAIKRAYLQQRNTYEVVGGLAAKSLVILRSILEALIYASFLFIIPFALIPMGFKIFLKWLWLLVWIQLWPPFYAILNSGIMTVARHQALQIPGLENGGGLSLFTSTGLHNLALDMQTCAAYASLSIPFISYALIQGGVAVLANVASSITGIAQGAAQSAAQDLTTGNYSYGNVQLETLSYNNQTMLQHNLAPTLSTGHFRENYGDTSTIFGKEQVVMQEQFPQLPVEVDLRDMYSHDLRRSMQEHSSLSENESTAQTSSLINQERQSAEWVKYVDNNESFSQAISSNSSKSVATAAHENRNKAETWGKQFGLDASTAYEILAEVGGSTKEMFISKIFPLHASTINKTSAQASASELYDSAKRFSQESGFTETHQALQDFAINKQTNHHDDVGQRLSQNIQKAYEETQTHQQHSELHAQKAEQYSRLADMVESRNIGITRKESQELVNFLAKQIKANGKERGIHETLYMIRHNPREFEVGVQQFVASKLKNLHIPNYLATDHNYHKAQEAFAHKNSERLVEHTHHQRKTMKTQQANNTSFKAVEQNYQANQAHMAIHQTAIMKDYQAQDSSVHQKQNLIKKDIQIASADLQKTYTEELQKTNIRRAYKQVPIIEHVTETVASACDNITGSFSIGKLSTHSEKNTLKQTTYPQETQQSDTASIRKENSHPTGEISGTNKEKPQ